MLNYNKKKKTRHNNSGVHVHIIIILIHKPSIFRRFHSLILLLYVPCAQKLDSLKFFVVQVNTKKRFSDDVQSVSQLVRISKIISGSSNSDRKKVNFFHEYKLALLKLDSDKKIDSENYRCYFVKLKAVHRE